MFSAQTQPRPMSSEYLNATQFRSSIACLQHLQYLQHLLCILEARLLTIQRVGNSLEFYMVARFQ